MFLSGYQNADGANDVGNWKNLGIWNMEDFLSLKTSGNALDLS